MTIQQKIDQLSCDYNVILEHVIAASVFRRTSEYLNKPHVLAQIFATPVCIFDATEEQKVLYNLPNLASDGNVLWVHQSSVDLLCDAIGQKGMVAQDKSIDIEKEVMSWFEDLAEKRYEKVTHITSDFKRSLLEIHQDGVCAQNIKLSCLDVPEEISHSWHTWVNACINRTNDQRFTSPLQSRFMVPLVIKNIKQRMDALHAYAQKDLAIMFNSERCTINEILAGLLRLEKYPERVRDPNEDTPTSIRLSKEFAQKQDDQIRRDLSSYVTSPKSADFAVDILSGEKQNKFKMMSDEQFIHVKLKYMVKHNAPIDYMLGFMMSVDKKIPWAADLTEAIFLECKNKNKLTNIALILVHNNYPHLITKELGQETLLELLDEEVHLHRLTNAQDLRDKLKDNTGGSVIAADFSPRKKP